MPEVDLDSLILAQQGDTQAFTELVEAHQVAVYNLCLRMLGDPYEAEDAAQETFLRAYKAMKTYDSKRSFSTWLLSIAAHYCIDQLRRNRLSVTHFEENPYLDVPDPKPTPEGLIADSEQQKRVRSLLNVLSETDRAAMIMFYWYDFSYEEIARALNLSISAVKSRMHRARLELAKTWNDQKQTITGLERQSYGSQAF
ncbi:MAG: RNA polymerase sigma factor [Chloroflexota bacterium]|nr:MAG: RNA polymerase sigma factor [Chloroflexota bacterium]